MVSEQTARAVRFILFVAGDSTYSQAAVANLSRLHALLKRDADEIEIVDIHEHPERAVESRILVTPTLVRAADARKRIIGDLSATSQLEQFLRQG